MDAKKYFRIIYLIILLSCLYNNFNSVISICPGAVYCFCFFSCSFSIAKVKYDPKIGEMILVILPDIPIPISIAKIIAFFFERFPKPLITRDQLRLLKYDSILSKECKSNIDIGFVSKLRFDDEILKYSYMWKEGGEYSK